MYLLPACAHYESRMVSVAQKHKLQLLLPVSQASGSKCRSVSQSSRHLCLFAAFKSACAVFFTSHDHIYAFLKEMYCSPLPNNDSSLFFFFFSPKLGVVVLQTAMLPNVAVPEISHPLARINSPETVFPIFSERSILL